uniref:Uncharacterized protein n=1 Tax=Hordeum vulgare subsp. vulgare TaxID=112509 RepID=A0A8I6Y120_HORVV
MAPTQQQESAKVARAPTSSSNAIQTVAKSCSNSCKKVVPPRPLCSDCHTVCSSKCDEDLETSCTESCESPLASCIMKLFEKCTEEGTCCSSNGTCTCDCKAQAQKRCAGITDNYTDCKVCKRSQYDPDCYPTCNNDCENNCKKKKGCHDHA